MNDHIDITKISMWAWLGDIPVEQLNKELEEALREKHSE